jgi:hypothetical protein
MHEFTLSTSEHTPSTPECRLPTHEYTLSRVSDDVLLRDLTALVSSDRLTTARILAHIAEVDARRLYAPAGYPSMYALCVEELRLSEDAAYKRIQAARAARRFPALFAAVAEGRLHLAAVCLLAPHLTVENAGELIQRATHRPKSEIEAMLVRRFPAEGALAPPGMVRAVPCGELSQLAPGQVGETEPCDDQLAPGQVGDAGRCHAQLAPGQVDGTVATPAELSPPERYLLQLTIGKATYEKLRYAQALLSHAVPSGEAAAVLDRALDALIGQLEGRKFGARARARGDGNARESRPRAADVRSASVRAAGVPSAGGRSASVPSENAGKRYIPARIRRAVWERDGGRCTFVGARGHRCKAKHFLQFDHVIPVARGGTATAEGLRLLCRAHNQYEADRVFGAEFMRRKRPEERTPPTRARAGTHEEHADLLAGLRSLGCRGELARRAADFSDSLPGASLEERLRTALQFIGKCAVRGGTPVRESGQGAPRGAGPEVSTRSPIGQTRRACTGGQAAAILPP